MARLGSDGALLFAATGSNAALVTFLIYTLAVFGLAYLSNRLLQKKSFLSEYFLGSRSLGVWAFALTFAATSSSGGSFTGFPSKIYSHGWILALWIGSYMVVPICTMGLLGKRINQVARISGSITVPDVIRDRFRSPLFGLLAVSLIVFFMSFNLVAQFKAGSLILKTLLDDVELFKDAALSLRNMKESVTFLSLNEVDSQYLICLFTFGIAVIIYTTYGGFHAVVWTDVMQGIVMLVGVLILLPLALSQVGGLESATREMAKMTPPVRRWIIIELDSVSDEPRMLTTDVWLRLDDAEQGTTRLFRVAKNVGVPENERSPSQLVEVLEITTPSEIDRFLANENQAAQIREDVQILEALRTEIPLVKHEVSVEMTTTASEATRLSHRDWISARDTEAGRTRFFRIVKTVEIAEGKRSPDEKIELLEVPALKDIDQLQADELRDARIRTDVRILEMPKLTTETGYGWNQQGVYVSGPGPEPKRSDGFLPLSLAISFFFMWAISGAGQPSNMVRLMAFNSSQTLRRSIFTVAIYYSMIYFPLVIIFCCARVLLPGMEVESDRIMPAMAVHLTATAGVAWLAGLLIAAPFAAVMSTVDSFLLMISSALVRDIYQRNLNPEAEEKIIKRLSYLFTLLVGTAAMLGAINPPQFLQDIIVYTGSGLAASFLAPVVYALYWPRVNTAGAISGMLAGFAAHLSMYLMGMAVNGSFYRPYQLFNVDPILVGLFTSFMTGYVVTKLTPPPPESLVVKYFGRAQGERPA